MPAPNRGSLHPFLVDLGYWRTRLGAMADIPQRLLIYPRPDLSEPGVTVEELCVRAHDRSCIPALLARSVFRRASQPVRIQPTTELEAQELDWEAVRSGFAQLLVQIPPGRPLIDRVLDLLRSAAALGSLPELAAAEIRIEAPPDQAPGDDVLIARHLLDETGLD